MEAATSSIDGTTSRPIEADAKESDKPHAAPLSAIDMRVGRPVRMHIGRGDADLRPLLACGSLRSLRIRPDTRCVRSIPPLWADELFASLPSTLEELQIERIISVRGSLDEEQLPSSLTRLQLSFFAPHGVSPQGLRYALSPAALLPPSLTDLSLDWLSRWGAVQLPNSLLTLRIDSLDEPLTLSDDDSDREEEEEEQDSSLTLWPLLPEGLQSLTLGRHTHPRLAGLSLPSTLTLLDLSETLFDQPLEAFRLPSGLRSLRLSQRFDQPIEQLQLPPSLTELHFHKDGAFNRPIERLQLPPSLTSLRLSPSFD